jgi:hypothetical protein
MNDGEDTPGSGAYPAELKDLLERGQRGDADALPLIKEAFDQFPEFTSMFGDLSQHAEQALLQLVAGTNLTAREAIGREVQALRERLLATAGSELEKLLIDRIAVSWIAVCHSDLELASLLLQRAGSSPAARAAQQRLDRAHARYLTAIKTLATTQKLLRRGPSPAELLRPVADCEAPSAGARCRTRGAASMAVAN